MIIPEGVDPLTSGMLIVTVAQSIILFGSEKWKVTTHSLIEMGIIHNWACDRI